VLLFMLAIVGSVNAYNFTDGLDGLAAGVAIPALLLFLGSPLAAALLGALLGFLWYNAHPARVFMGGVGAEALGAAIAGLAILAGAVWWLPLIALLPVLEVVSVIVQVAYFRATGGKRLLRMAPLHHHFELSGWPETRLVVRFWVVTAALVALVHHLSGGFGA
jgi:phospho-N-acetylmuramoyl-pentapeptide-transferase